ncbi:hypothetical protein DCAR_0933523 [Daucus carota subsp. sativus]|uniref:Ubiquitin-like protease family profile domain-containing protein n=1 Tax=Daucus carota subsp. sativus TaxID=79200 RepID=A0AAF0XTL8_DAUCS|nr:hypothetical protein DCAR_0933523 [Daucus carota subsp. sativus]
MEKLKKEFGETLDKGKQLFPESDKMKEYEQRFEEMTTGRIEIFLWNNVTCLKHHIQSLQIGKEVLFHVVDAYTSILNEDEKFRAAESPYRFFCSTMVTIFFPISSGNHFYLICFNLRKICVDIIDNRSGDRVDIMYDGIPEALQENFGLYMAQKSPRKIKLLNNAPVQRLEMKWRTSNKNVDSGVFVMHHMETYMGYTLRNWDCKFAAEVGCKTNLILFLK